MKVLIQRVKHAAVSVDQITIGEIAKGLLLFVGIEKHDKEETLEKMCKKVLSYRVFSDEKDKMNLSVSEIGGAILVVSQFTLAANTNKGLRPSFSSAAPPDRARAHYQSFIESLQHKHPMVASGRFGADMQVSLENDGPVTFLLEM